MDQQGMRIGLDALVASLRAAGEDTRLRILALLDQGELSVSDLTDILGQSQPRISRHLKLMAEAGLVVRHREGAWAFFRIADRDPAGQLARQIVGRVDPVDPVLAADRGRLAAVRSARAAVAQAYFDRHAAEWDRIRSLHVADDVVEAAILDCIGAEPVRALLDLGTGTGRLLALLAGRAGRLVGVDTNHAMLAVARANLERAGVIRAELRQGDIYALPVERGAFDLVLVHQVLHYLDDPGRAIREAALALAPGGKLVVVDFAPHGLEFLRERHAHRRLGFERAQVEAWFEDAGVEALDHRTLETAGEAGDKLTVSLWVGRGRRTAPGPVKEVA
ncbi:metalloregulator ArsR/SmtB family transcription factor [Alsobacter sp. SYSU M60028]|uniref:Metalloregulator ArsR/SmtB family transcription factor n=1 Tax=Alsobacter ponti TaxID=2962936 RepID=A0ABT1L8B7_9HYPH|nr:metalloregulator ArsR/SmtB family transcription factor [Alsobacter ponti]MCP8937163.1 metalloregulator ArsR/SmtB family transcription factor [Alsobacter ponti]